MGLGKGEASGTLGVQELDSQGRRRRSLLAKPIVKLVGQQERREPTWHLLRELQGCPVWTLRKPGSHEPRGDERADQEFGGLPCCLLPVRFRRLRLEVGSLGRRRL